MEVVLLVIAQQTRYYQHEECNNNLHLLSDLSLVLSQHTQPHIT